MMSEGESQAPMWGYQVNLDKRVRDDHLAAADKSGVGLGFCAEAGGHTLTAGVATNRCHRQ
jgi:hypothetical protein